MKRGVRLIVIVLVVCALFILAIECFKAFNGASITAGVNTYDSFEKLESKYSYDLDIPDFIRDKIYQEECVNSIYSGSHLTIQGETFKYSAAPYIATNITVTGSLNNPTKTEMYKTNNSDIHTIRYQENSEYLAISWFTGEMMYGVSVKSGSGYTLEYLVESLGINYKSLSIENSELEKEDTADDSAEGSIDDKTIMTFGSLGISLEIPNYINDKLITVVETIKNGDSNDSVTFIYDGAVIFIVEQTATSPVVSADFFNNIETGGYTLRYPKSNPYKNEDSFQVYEELLEEFEGIAESLKIIE